MKKKFIGIRIIIGMCAALGWWGLFYPELALTPESVKVISEDENGIERDVTGEWEFDSALLQELINAKEGKVRFRSRLLTEWNVLVEAVQNADK